MTRPLRYWTLRFSAGLVILLCAGASLPASCMAELRDQSGNYVVADLLVGLAGFLVALRAVSPLVRSLSDDARLRSDWGTRSHAAFARATTPQQVYQLLLAVAQADGRTGAAERELVLRFLRMRFTDPITRSDLQAWESRLGPTRDLRSLRSLARSVARGLDLGERSTLYSWSCLIALAGAAFGVREREALRAVARGLAIDEIHARMLFLFAHQLHQRGAGAGAGGGPADHAGRQGQGHQGHQGRVPPPRPAVPRSERERAFATLDLPPDATSDQIRRRHRELVRRFHPDAQPNLGAVAQQEATERFREIQLAYEMLTR